MDAKTREALEAALTAMEHQDAPGHAFDCVTVGEARASGQVPECVEDCPRQSRADAMEAVRALLDAPEPEPPRGKLAISFLTQSDGHGGWDVTEPVSALCISEHPTEADASRVAADLRAYFGAMRKP